MKQTRLLEGIRILALEQVMVVPYATAILADMGAEVIRIEHPEHLDDRRSGPWPDNIPGEQWWNEGGTFAYWNRSKKSLCLDVYTPRGRELFLKLVLLSDIVVDNFRTGTMERLGLDHESLANIKPDIITLTCNAFGSTGPYRAYGSRARTIDSFCGLSSISGYEGGPALRASSNYMDHTGALNNAFLLLLAIYHKRKTGQGLRLDASMYETGIQSIGPALLEVQKGIVQERTGSAHPYWKAPYNVYPTQGTDQWIAISVSSDEEWARLKDAMGQPEWACDARLDTVPGRWEHRKELDRHLAEWTSHGDHVTQMHRLQQHRVPAGAVYSASELLQDPHLEQRGYLASIPPEEATNSGSRRYAGRAFADRPFHMPKVETRMRPAPDLGEHNQEVFRGLLGLSAQEIARLKQEGIVLDRPSANDLASPPQPGSGMGAAL
ncbi:MAG: CoA transferase [Chloroflexi bacterium]|nr:CoA transferase [Chloroflexota bacterium]